MGKKVSELTSLSEVTDGDFFMVTDDTTGASRRVAWSAVKSSIPGVGTEDLDDLDDVDVTTAAPSDGSALVYDSSSSKWVPGSVSEIDGSSPVKGTRYTYSNSVSPTGISSGMVRFNSTVPAGTNVMYIHDTDLDGIDHTSILSVLFQQNAVFLLRSTTNTSHYVKFAVSGYATDMGSYFTVPVRHIESVAYPSNNSEARFTNATQMYSLEAAQNFTLPEDTAAAIDFKQSNDSYIKIDTTSSAKKITVGQDITFSGDIIDSLTLKSDSINGGSFRIYQGDDNTDAPDIRLYKSRGSTGSPATTATNDVFSRISSYGYDGSQYVQSGNIGFVAADGDGNSTFELKTRVSDTLATRLSISSGNVLIGTTTETAQSDRLLTIGDTSRTYVYTELRTSDSGGGGIVWSDGTDGSNSGYRGTIEYFHNTEKMTVKTASTERVSIDTETEISTNVKCHGNIELDSTAGFTSPKIKLHASTGVIDSINTPTAMVRFTGSSAATNLTHNVSGVTRLAAGRYRVTFSTAMDNTDYLVQVSSNQVMTVIDSVATASFEMSVFDSDGDRVDTNIICASVFGGLD